MLKFDEYDLNFSLKPTNQRSCEDWNAVGKHLRTAQALLWEAFFVDCLGSGGFLGRKHSIFRAVSGAQPRRPADWRQERVPADLAFSLGQELGTLIEILWVTMVAIIMLL